MSVAILSTAFNPISGVFGQGNVRVFATSGIWNVPPGVGAVRARMWGGGGGTSGGGGGFSLVEVYNLSGVVSIPVTVAQLQANNVTGGTSSFGTYASATGGATNAGPTAGTGVGGDINYAGGLGAVSGGGGGAASIFGNGGAGGSAALGQGMVGGAGGGATGTGSNTGGNGFLGTGASFQGTAGTLIPPTSGLSQFSIDFIGTGGGGNSIFSGINGGGGGQGNTPGGNGGFPGGGGGQSLQGAAGLVIVEW